MRIPKNIRQIGEVEEGKKVYIEDYVMTYTRKLADKDSDDKMAVLLGQAEWVNNYRHLFINGAVEIQNFQMETETVFSNEVWSEVYDKIKAYFDEVEIVGWVFAKPGQEFRIDDRLRKIHLENFSGQDKVFMIYDALEKEEGLFIYTGNHFKRLKGYYIYYEKNVGMQNYMVEGKGKQGSSNEEEESSVKEMRNVMSNRKEEQTTKKFANYMYGMGTVVAAVILIIGTSILNSQSKMKNMEDTLNVISDNLSGQDSDKIDENGSKVAVETLDGDLNRDSKDADSNDSEEWLAANTKEPDQKGQPVGEGNTQAGNATPKQTEEAPSQEASNGEVKPEGPATESPQSKETAVGEPSATGTQTGNPVTETPSVETQVKETPAAKTQTKTASATKSPSKGSSSAKNNESANKSNSDSNKKTEGTNSKKEANTQPYDYYIVKKGDTLSQISEKLFHSIWHVNAIKELNNMNNEDVIYEGQKIMVPRLNQ